MAERSGRRPRTALWLGLLYLVLALPVTLALASATLPFDVADEGAHLFRVYQIGGGGLLAARDRRGQVGGELPLSLVQASELINRYWADRSMRLDRANLAFYDERRWNGPLGFYGFANTAIYPPFFYVPAALTVDLGRALDLRVIPTLRLARIADGVASVVLAAASLVLAESGTPILAVVLALPMTLSLFGSVSQDALLIATAALSAALLTRQAAGRSVGWAGWLLSGSLLGLLGAARPPYLLLAALPLLLAGRRRDRIPGASATLLAGLIGLSWLAVSVMPLSVATRAGGGLLSGVQAGWVRTHPLDALGVIWRSLAEDWLLRLREFIGVLGWLDILLRGSAYRVCRWALFLALLATLAAPPATLVRRLPVALLLLAVVVAVEAALYLAWSPVGASDVIGVQGRYFLPVALFAALLGRRAGPVSAAIAAALLVTVVLFADLSAIGSVERLFRPSPATLDRAAG